jgi:hypothetical protein
MNQDTYYTQENGEIKKWLYDGCECSGCGCGGGGAIAAATDTQRHHEADDQ